MREVTPIIREHPIPSANSKPYIVTNGPDGAIWFCLSGPGKIGRMALADGSMREFGLPDASCAPIGIIAGGSPSQRATTSDE